jgi:tetratricopeptide (TPR) repeat protein
MFARFHRTPRGPGAVLCRHGPAAGLLLLLLAVAGCGTLLETGAVARRQTAADANYARALAHYSTGLLLESEHGRTGDVQQAFEAAHRLDPDSRPPVEAQVMRLLREGRTREALDQLENYCQRHPDDAGVRCDLARLAESNDDFARAARYYAEAFRLLPDDLTLAFAHVRALFAGRQDASAIAAMRRLNREHACVDTRNLPTYWAIQFFHREHAAARALPCLDLACDVATGATQRVELRFFYGEAALAAGRTNDALRAFQQTLASRPMHIRAVMSLAQALYTRDGAAAIEAQARRTARAPTDVPGLLTLAALHLAAKDRTRAVPILARAQDAILAQQMIPSADIALLHGATLDELGRHEEAAAVFQDALRRHPRADVIMNYLAYMWAVANVRLDEAARWAQLAVKQRPRSGAYLDTLGWVRYRQQRFEEALDLLLRARERLPDDPAILDHIGDVLAQLKRTPEAAAFWSRSYAIDPAQPAVAEKLRHAGVNPAAIPRLEPSTGEALDDLADED